MKAWFEDLAQREQIAVLTAAIFIAFALFYFTLWVPLDRSQTATASGVATWERAIVELRSIKAIRGPAAGTAPRTPSNLSLVVVVDTTLRERELYGALQRSQPTGPNGIRLEFKDVAFDDLIRWLGDVGGLHGMQVQSGNFSMSAQNIPGRVNASLNIER